MKARVYSLLLSGVHIRHGLVASLVGGRQSLAVDDLLLVLNKRAGQAAEGTTAVAQDVSADVIHGANVGAAEEGEEPGKTAVVGADKHQAVGVESLVVLHLGITETSLGLAVDEARAAESLQAEVVRSIAKAIQ